MTEDEARTQVAKEKKFYGALASYVVTMTLLAGLNLFTSPGTWWFVWPLLGWGIVSQGVATFGVPGMGAWEERRVQALAGHEVSESRLRQMLDETLDERAVPAGAPQTADRLQRRIEHLEAIVTSRDWDAALVEPLPRLRALDAHSGDGAADETLSGTPAEQAARIARRVR